MKNVKAGHTRPIVCLDAGHYGKYNRSPAIKSYYESDMTWKLHLLLKTELEKYDIEVWTTRADKSKDLGLNARGKASKGSDLLISLHSNAVGTNTNEAVDYVAVYHLYDDTGTDVDDKSKALAKMLAPVIADTMGVKQGSRVTTRRGSGDHNGDGVLNDNYYSVLNGCRLVGTPGLIVEHSFHTNTNATKWLLDDNNLAKMAKAEALVIAKYFDVQKDTNIEVDGIWGKDTTTRLQQIFGTTIDGVISNQWASYKSKNPGLMGGWEWKDKPNGKGSQLIKAMQKWAGMASTNCDGEIGPDTIKALQKKLGTPADGYVSSPSKMVKALQEWANKQ